MTGDPGQRRPSRALKAMAALQLECTSPPPSRTDRPTSPRGRTREAAAPLPPLDRSFLDEQFPLRMTSAASDDSPVPSRARIAARSTRPARSPALLGPASLAAKTQLMTAGGRRAAHAADARPGGAPGLRGSVRARRRSRWWRSLARPDVGRPPFGVTTNTLNRAPVLQGLKEHAIVPESSAGSSEGPSGRRIGQARPDAAALDAAPVP